MQPWQGIGSMAVGGKVGISNLYYTITTFILFGVCCHFSLVTCTGSHGLLKQGNPEYDAKRRALFEYYHPLEFSPHIPIEEKTKLMEEWYVANCATTMRL